MEFLEGGNLSSFIETYELKDENISEEIIIEIYSQLVSVLQYLSDHRVIHKDIKSNNILFLKSGFFKIVDSGLSKILPKGKEKIEATNEYNGSIPFVSPELAHNDFYSFPTDLWSLGVVIYQLMTFEYPFDDSDSSQILKKIKDEEEDFPEITKDYSEELKWLVYRMLDKNQYERIDINELSKRPLLKPINVNLQPYALFWKEKNIPWVLKMKRIFKKHLNYLNNLLI
jgi:serine/threonine protein kinase